MAKNPKNPPNDTSKDASTPKNGVGAPEVTPPIKEEGTPHKSTQEAPSPAAIDDLWDDDVDLSALEDLPTTTQTPEKSAPQTVPANTPLMEVAYAQDDPSSTADLDSFSLNDPLEDIAPESFSLPATPEEETPLTQNLTPTGTKADAEFIPLGDEMSMEYILEDEEKLPPHERHYLRVLHTLRLSENLNVDSLAVARIKELLEQNRLPQLAVRDLINEELIDQQQLARAMARSQHRMEISTLQDLPEGARMLRQGLDGRVQNTLREKRIIPLRDRILEDGSHELHLAHSAPMRDLITEATLADNLPGYQFIWHYGAPDVCGQFWVTGDEGTDLEEGMEAESLLDRVITTAVDAKASDIHIDPNMKGEEKATIKYRVDGAVRPREVISTDQLERLRIRIENIARMPKVDQNHPNKGAFSRAGFDWRVQIQPHAGRSGSVPRIVIRRLNPDSLSMERLGYPKAFIQKIQAAARATNGVIFWTGPTGSGKTESIHSAVISVDPMARGLSVHTIEDPPEKRVEGYAVQMEVAETDDSRTGLELLKSSLRADPDVIIFGEVRDNQMAKLVFEAANTGHLVFSTLHTNTSIDAIIRLDELEIRGFLVSYIRGIAAQRLVRRLCTHCRQPMEKPDQWTQFCFDKYSVPTEGATLYTANPEGCPNCGFTGYRGRIAVAEWLVPSKDLVQATADRDFTKLEELALASGWEPMGKMGVHHVKEGITDAEELGRVILELSVELRDRALEEEETKQISRSEEDVRV